MSIPIIWPENILLTDVIVEKRYIEAVAKNLIPADTTIRTPWEMAEALERAGLIRLK